MINNRIHKWLKIPHSLHVRHRQRPKKPRASILFIHGLGNTGAAWDGVIDRLPDDFQIYSVDLLGFGHSPHPAWSSYDAKAQAQSLAVTLLKLRNTKRLIVVGHSLGALVAIELAKRYPGLVKQLLLCSPPLYSDRSDGRILPSSDKLLKDLYEKAISKPDRFLALSSFAKKYQLANEAFNVTADNFESYSRTLKAAIINQTSLKDVQELNLPVRIIIGKVDPLIVAGTIRKLARLKQNVSVVSILSGHEVTGRYIDSVVKQLKAMVND